MLAREVAKKQGQQQARSTLRRLRLASRGCEVNNDPSFGELLVQRSTRHKETLTRFYYTVEFNYALEELGCRSVQPRSDTESTVAQILTERGVKDFSFAEGNLNQAGLPGSCPSGRFVFEVKRIRSASIESVIGGLSAMILQARARVGKTIPVPLLVVDRMGSKTKQAVRQFMSANAHEDSWGLADRLGAAMIVIPSLYLDIDQPAHTAATRLPRHTPARLFSDLNRWMLKVLLLADTPQELWGGPRQQVATPTQLHRVANVSVEKAHQFYRTFEQIGLLRQTRDGLAVVDKRKLMDIWFHDERSRGIRRIPVRWILGEPSDLSQVFAKPGGPADFAVCGFEACRALGVLHAPVATREVYLLGDADAALAAWDLEACDDRDAHFVLRSVRPAKSIMRGRLVKANLPVVDVLQAAIDVCGQAARGAEQAEYVIHHVLGWRDGE